MSRFAKMLRSTIVVLCAGWSLLAAAHAAPPNIVLIMADDLGVAELGCYGQKLIKTPELDRMAKEGLRFTNFYTGSPVCAPSRCVLMTGLHGGHAFVRDNREIGSGQGQQPIPADAVTMASVLKKTGYATAAFGKWGLGNPGGTGEITKHGFDLFVGYHDQYHAHSHYPTHLFRNGEKFELPGNTGGKGTQHTQDIFDDEAAKFLDAQAAAKTPFFLYFPTTLTHVSLHIPQKYVDEYRGKLGDDPAFGKETDHYTGHATPHAAYAAMVTRLDTSVGKLRKKLADLKLADNTLVVFLSDNGPTHGRVGGADSKFFNSTGGLRGLKGDVYEGGIRSPLLAVWPATIAAGGESELLCASYDLFPTFCDVAKIDAPNHLDGLSIMPTLLGKSSEQKPHDYLFWEFGGYGGQQAIRYEHWKAVRRQLNKGTIKTEIYDLRSDPNETTDVAADVPAVAAKMETIFKEARTPNPIFKIQAIDGATTAPPPGKAAAAKKAK
ncbi:MAG: arylsulfatase [Pirellulales bacterium]